MQAQTTSTTTTFRVYTTLGTKYIEAENPAGARAAIKKRFPTALITKVKPVKGARA